MAPRTLACAASLLALAGGASAFVTTLTSPIPIVPLEPGTPGTSELTANYLTAPEAVCNDGSPAAYYYKAGSGSMTNTYMVYLEGSMFCFDATSCNLRYQNKPFWMSSKSWSDTLVQGGIFSGGAENPFANVNMVYVKYCSSDLWMGDIGASTDTFGYNFRGYAIIMAVIQALVDNKGLGQAPGQRLLFGGCSAGAIGAMNALDSVAAAAPAGVKVQGLLDAAALVDVNPADGGWSWSSQLTPLQTLFAEVAALVNPQLPPACETQFPGEVWKCMWGSYRLPLVQTPAFINAPQYDSFEIDYDTDNYAPMTTTQTAFVNSFQTAVRTLISELPSTISVFSATCMVHCLSGQATFADLTVNGISMSTAVAEWFFQGESVHVVSACTGWACTNQCGLDPQGLACNIVASDPTCKLYPAPEESASAPRGAANPTSSGAPPARKQFPVSLEALSGSLGAKTSGSSSSDGGGKAGSVTHMLSNLFMQVPAGDSSGTDLADEASEPPRVLNSTIGVGKAPAFRPGATKAAGTGAPSHLLSNLFMQVPSGEASDSDVADAASTPAQTAHTAAGNVSVVAAGGRVSQPRPVPQVATASEASLDTRQQQELFQLMQGQEKLQIAAQALGRRRLSAKRCCGQDE